MSDKRKRSKVAPRGTDMMSKALLVEAAFWQRPNESLGRHIAKKRSEKRQASVRRWMQRYLGSDDIVVPAVIERLVTEAGMSVAEAVAVELRFRGTSISAIARMFGDTVDRVRKRLAPFEDLLLFRESIQRLEVSQAMEELIPEMVAMAKGKGSDGEKDDRIQPRDKAMAFRELREILNPKKSASTMNIATHGGVIQQGEQNLTSMEVKKIEGMAPDAIRKRIKEIERKWERQEPPGGE